MSVRFKIIARGKRNTIKCKICMKLQSLKKYKLFIFQKW